MRAAAEASAATVRGRSDGAVPAVLRAVRGHRRPALAALLAAVVAAAGWLALHTPQYAATAQILVSPLPSSDDTFVGLPLLRDSGDPTRTMQTAVALLESVDAAGTTARRLGGKMTASRVREAVDVQAHGQTDIVDVIGRERSPRVAEQLANTFARAALQQHDAIVAARAAPLIRQARAELTSTPAGGATAADLQARLPQLQRVAATGDPTMSFSRTALASGTRLGASPALVVALILLAGVVIAVGAALLAAAAEAPSAHAPRRD